ncbi:MAG TPA: GntR family transcriptional regulator [Streptosporangiaceae bacterium]|jgi:GntR family transcriptional regulator
MADPRWRQIADDLRQKIEVGKLGAEGKALPSELELREMYDASRNTVRDAIKLLVARGLVVTRPGQGTFAVQRIDPFVSPISIDLSQAGGGVAAFRSEVAAARRAATVSEPRVEIQTAKAPIDHELAIASGTTVISRHQQRSIDGTPWSLQTSFYPMRLIEKGATRLLQAEDIPEGVLAYVAERLQIVQAGRRDRYSARLPDRNETEFFSLPEGGGLAAVFEVTQTSFDESGSPFRVTVTTYPADRNQFLISIGDVPDDE